MNTPRSTLTPHFDGIAREQLLVSACSRCATPEFPPRAQCIRCADTTPPIWQTSSGLGRIWSFVTFHKAYLPDFYLPTPYVVAVIELDEGMRLYGNVIGTPTAELYVGRSVRAVFDSGAGRDTHLAFTPTNGEQ